ncbi:MAG: sulfotransferase [Spirochaetota bacterium]|nr:sulfotransferase [Spirochaetota bacterium]
MTDRNLIFIVSQPRSGSTLLQSLLSNNSEVNTTSEPWILLPFLNIFDESLVEAKYNQGVALDGFFDFIEKTDRGYAYKDRLKEFILSLYKPLLKDGIKYIIDKTPRYYHILPIIKCFFPEAKIILLKRNPLAVIHSMIETWGESGTISDLAVLYEDIMDAPLLIQDFIDNSKDNSDHVMEVFYEEVVNDPDNVVKKLYDWLELSYHTEVLDYSHNDKYKGIMGDPTGVQQKSKPDKTSVDSWKERLNNPYWQDFYRGYVKEIGEGVLERFGYLVDIKGGPSEVFNEYQSQNKILYYKQIINQRSMKVQPKELYIKSLMHNLIEQKEKLGRSIKQLQKSFIWRITKPLRWITSLLKKLLISRH